MSIALADLPVLLSTARPPEHLPIGVTWSRLGATRPCIPDPL